jgi:hypothetical protein
LSVLLLKGAAAVAAERRANVHFVGHQGGRLLPAKTALLPKD